MQNIQIEHSQAERIKNSYQEINFVKNMYEVLALYQQHCNVIVEIMNIKYALFSKYLFQRAQQHDGYTKRLGKDKFV